jgi:hypothetical protein
LLHLEHGLPADPGVAPTSRGLPNLPSRTGQVNADWVKAASIAAALAAWTRLPGHYGGEKLGDAGPDTLRYRISNRLND